MSSAYSDFLPGDLPGLLEPGVFVRKTGAVDEVVVELWDSPNGPMVRTGYGDSLDNYPPPEVQFPLTHGRNRDRALRWLWDRVDTSKAEPGSEMLAAPAITRPTPGRGQIPPWMLQSGGRTLRLEGVPTDAPHSRAALYHACMHYGGKRDPGLPDGWERYRGANGQVQAGEAMYEHRSSLSILRRLPARKTWHLLGTPPGKARGTVVVDLHVPSAYPPPFAEAMQAIARVLLDDDLTASEDLPAPETCTWFQVGNWVRYPDPGTWFRAVGHTEPQGFVATIKAEPKRHDALLVRFTVSVSWTGASGKKTQNRMLDIEVDRSWSDRSWSSYDSIEAQVLDSAESEYQLIVIPF